ncbi:restriction endonuclease subunit S [Ligaoa zhengdingensis]|uniref:restriction endonuclease subunit S n=2 Tax=Ligaoa zhengdingensis TaxID=2763658 RepID=UPI0031BBAB3A
MARLGDVFPLVRNGASIKQTDGAAGIPITRIETISNREIDRNKFGYADIIDDSKYKDYILQDGDILMSHINSEKHLGKVALYRKQGDEQIVHGMNLLMLRANSSVLFPPFATYFFETSAFLMQIKKITKKSVNQASFTVTSLKEIEIPLPPLDEQRKIAAVLDKVSNLIAKRRQQLDKLDEMVKSRFIEMFGEPIVNSMHWPEELIGNSCFVTKLAGFEYTQYIHYEDSGDVVMVKAQNVKNGKLNRKDLSYISNEVSNSLPRSQLTAGDIVMTYVGANIGDVAVIDYEYKYHLAPNVAKIRPNSEKYNSIYFMYMLMFLNSYIVGNSADTAKAALGMERIRKLKIFAPPVDLQKQFAAFVIQTDKSKAAIQKSLETLETLKKSLMQQYFG